ncbi:cupin domain-containing protein [Amycolatopsis anabasis]|uniref:cupin domain-containing protein n=1 Tax=Amycolatopsis anabasis TaxID=1840409 RepID=UPI00131B0C43|nr:cupin domain-containing protein [Amycolatopsis anabasis]
MGESGNVWQILSAVEGLDLLGGTGEFRLRERTPSGLLYEIRYPAGVASPEHSHDHDSVVYLLSGQLRGTLDGRPVEVEPGQTMVHPKGIAHTVEAIVDSQWLEFKAPVPGRMPIE